MRWKRISVAKVVLVGTLIAAVVPPGIDWEMVYASTTSGANVVRTDQELQKMLLSSINQRLSQVQFIYQGKTDQLKGQLKKALEQVLESDPYMNYTIESYGYSYSGNTKSANVNVQLSYRETADQTAYVSKRVRSILDDIIKPGMNDHEKIKVIHDWVVLHLKYDDSLRNYTAYDGLSSGKAVCQGYSLLTYKMLKDAGIKNLIVEGTAAPRDTGISQLHAWNLVLLDGKWYHLDTTWDDPAPDKTGEVGINYYLRTDVQMKKDHNWTKSYPLANTLYRDTMTKLISRNDGMQSFYKKLKIELEYQLYDSSEIVNSSSKLRTKVKAVIKQGEQSLLFRYHGSHVNLMDDLQGLYRLGINSISYVESELDETKDLRVYVTWK
ncbi:transglutaminase domain-containing protein [Paenibacillus sp.]|uniref:transglutaminase domain-containing protein n=1 Tax=Paenibacillus sp. TaxID=58172 RepID=UPI002828FE5D|nr:transglutaminase domain-containing protein [Paenibacillus sp.]MDR0270770.1 transglutaminase [Paenibacillus sp.]